MVPDEVKFALAQEAMRRRADLGNSGAGVPGGMDTTNAQTPVNPIAMSGQTAQPTSAVSPGTVAPNPYQGATQALGQAAPEHAVMIIRSLSKALDKSLPDVNRGV